MYATPALYRSLKRKENVGGFDDDATIEIALDWATDFINQHCGRSFDSEPAAVQSWVLNDPYAASVEVYEIGDWVSVSSVMVGDTVLEAHEYAVVRTGVGLSWPYEYICFPNARKGTLTLSGTRGWASVPSGIKLVCVEAAALWRLQTARAFQVAGVSEGRDITDVAQRIFGKTLSQYRRHDLRHQWRD